MQCARARQPSLPGPARGPGGSVDSTGRHHLRSLGLRPVRQSPHRRTAMPPPRSRHMTREEIAALLGDGRLYSAGRDRLYTVDELMSGYRSDAPMENLDARIAAHVK